MVALPEMRPLVSDDRSELIPVEFRANLPMAAPRGELTGADGEAQMRAALTATGLDGLLATLPEGLDTQVGAGGTALSGGERRRLAAARALLARPGRRPAGRTDRAPDAPTATALVADLRAALAGRLVVCVTHDGLERPGDTVVRLSRSHPTVRVRA
jgi:ATP-binding cassette subfamily C protein CydCD